MKTKNIPGVKQAVSILLIAGMMGGCEDRKSTSTVDLDNNPVVATWKTVGSDSVLVGNIGLLKDTLIIPLSSFVEDLQLIRLDNRDEALVKGHRCFVSDHYIALQSSSQQPVKLFDHEGKYLNDIGAIGHGPNEYVTTIYYAQIDEANDRIYLVPWAGNSKILVYDLKGNGYPPIPLPYTAPKMRFQVNLKKGIVRVGALPFKGGNCPAVWVQDLQGNVLQEVGGEPYAVVPDFSNEVEFRVTPEKTSYYIFHWPAQADSLYRYKEKENRLVPYYTMEHGGTKVPEHDYAELLSYIVGSVSRSVEVSPNQFQILPTGWYIIDPPTGKGSYFKVVNDFLDNSPIEEFVYVCTDSYFIQNYAPGNLLDKIEARLASPDGLTEEQKATLTKLSETITVDDNNVILLGKLKKDISPAEGPVMVEVKQSAAMGKPVRRRTAAPVSTPPPPPAPGNGGNTAPPPPPPPTSYKPGIADTTIYDRPAQLPVLKDWQSYFLNNNKYSDWDASKPKVVMVSVVVEKTGRVTNPRIVAGGDAKGLREVANSQRGTCGVKKLDEEALRLAKGAAFSPAKNDKGEAIRSKYIMIVRFPAQKE